MPGSERLHRLGLAVALALLLGGCRDRPVGDDAGAGGASAKPAPAPVVADPTRPVRIIDPGTPTSFVDLAAQLRDSVVSIHSTTRVTGGPGEMYPDQAPSQALGSGFIYDGNGHIVTNDHLIASAAEVRVVLADGTSRPAQVIGRDPKLDIALLRVDDFERLKPVALGDSDDLRVGEWIVAMGNPFGTGILIEPGVVAALSLDATESQARAQSWRGDVHLTASVTRANTGGPVVNLAGQVVAVARHTDRADPSINLAVPINRVKVIAPMLRDDGVVRRAWLGVVVLPVTSELGQQLRLPEATGALVTSVKAGSPAAKAGIQRGDVIFRFAGERVDHRSLSWRASTTGIGRQVEVGVWRGGSEMTLRLVTEEMPD